MSFQENNIVAEKENAQSIHPAAPQQKEKSKATPPENAEYNGVFFRYEGNGYSNIPYCGRCKGVVCEAPMDNPFIRGNSPNRPFVCSSCGKIFGHIKSSEIPKIIEMLNHQFG